MALLLGLFSPLAIATPFLYTHYRTYNSGYYAQVKKIEEISIKGYDNFYDIRSSLCKIDTYTYKRYPEHENVLLALVLEKNSLSCKDIMNNLKTIGIETEYNTCGKDDEQKEITTQDLLKELHVKLDKSVKHYY